MFRLTHFCIVFFLSVASYASEKSNNTETKIVAAQASVSQFFKYLSSELINNKQLNSEEQREISVKLIFFGKSLELIHKNSEKKHAITRKLRMLSSFFPSDQLQTIRNDTHGLFDVVMSNKNQSLHDIKQQWITHNLKHMYSIQLQIYKLNATIVSYNELLKKIDISLERSKICRESSPEKAVPLASENVIRSTPVLEQLKAIAEKEKLEDYDKKCKKVLATYKRNELLKKVEKLENFYAEITLANRLLLE